MGKPVVEVADLVKTFRVSEREEGLGATVRSVFRRRYRDVHAVAGISFGIEPGEVVGFLGPNGAGKTTTLKMLSGLLFPTSGRATVLGHVPRRGSSAERPIGPEVRSRRGIGRFVAESTRRKGATVLLTSHYMDDVVALCRRVLVIHHGKLLYDGALAGLAERMTPYKLIVATLHDGAAHEDLGAYGAIVAREEGRVTLRVPRENVAERTARLVGDLGDRLADLSVEDPPIEEAVDRIFSGEPPVATA